jgi:Tfp pilus assembly protein PilO
MIEKTSWFKNQSIYRYVRQQAENKKFFKYLEVSATFLLITVFLTTAIAPTASAISKLLGEIKSKEITTKSMKQKIINVVSAQNNYAQAQEKFKILESSYPSSPEFYLTASNLSSLTRNSGVSIDQLKYNLSNNKNTDQKKYSYDVNLLLNGLYPGFLNTINNIVYGRRLIDVNSITINQTADKLSLDLSTNLPYLPLTKNNE